MPERSFTRRRLERIVAEALGAAGVAGELPTPLEALRSVAGVRAVEPIDRLPRDLTAEPAPAPTPCGPTTAPSGRATVRASVLGALWFEERTIYVDETQSAPRRRFTEAHELVHALCPWHEAVLRLDTEAELFRPVVSAIEAEANAGAGLLIFQGRGFERRVAGEQPSIALALELAAVHGASAHATLHHLVEVHPLPAALLVAGRFPTADGALPVWRSVRSTAFDHRFGTPHTAALAPNTPLHELAEAARGAGRATVSLPLPDRTGRPRPCVAEAYYNRHAFLVLITEPAARAASAALAGRP